MENSNTVGQLLKLKREQKNISLETVAHKTKININVLKHLENDEMDKLPNKTYVKGFVSNYAKAVGWSSEEAKEALAATYSLQGEGKETSRSNLGSLQTSPETREEEELKETFLSIAQSFFNKKIMYGVAALIVLILIGKGIVGFFSQLNYERTKTPEVTLEKEAPLKDQSENILEPKVTEKLAKSNDDKKTGTESVSVKEVETKPVAKKLKEEAEPEEEKPVVKEEEKKETAKKLPAGKFPFKNFYQAPLRTFEVVENSPEAANPELLPPSIKNSMSKGKQNVYIIATEGDTWIAYQKDNEDIKKYVLKNGKRVFLKADRVKLFMGNYNVTKVFYNNELISAFTRTGVKSLIFPQEAGKDLKLPLFPTYQGRSYTSEQYIERMVEQEDN